MARLHILDQPTYFSPSLFSVQFFGVWLAVKHLDHKRPLLLVCCAEVVYKPEFKRIIKIGVRREVKIAVTQAFFCVVIYFTVFVENHRLTCVSVMSPCL